MALTGDSGIAKKIFYDSERVKKFHYGEIVTKMTKKIGEKIVKLSKITSCKKQGKNTKNIALRINLF